MGAELTLPLDLRYPNPVICGRFVRRYKRFFAEVRAGDGALLTAHCANTGSMQGMLVPDAPCRLSPATNPKRKLRYTLEQICLDGRWTSAHPGRSNAVVVEAVRAGRVPELVGYDTLRPEAPLGAGRCDLGLSAPDRPDCVVEVKTVTLLQDGVARFPDAVTERGRRHLAELSAAVASGRRAVLLFVVARGPAEAVEAAAHIDPRYAEALVDAVAAGVEVYARQLDATAEGLRLGQAVPVRANPGG